MKVASLTGRLTGHRSHPDTTGSGGGEGYGSAEKNTAGRKPTHIGAHGFENLRLQFANGQRSDLLLEDFDLAPDLGDVITIDVASRRGGARPFAALSHTSNS